MSHQEEKILCSHCQEIFVLSGDESPCPKCRTTNFSSHRLRQIIHHLDAKALELRVQATKLQVSLTYRERLRTSTTMKAQPILYTPETFWKNVHGVPRDLISRKGGEVVRRPGAVSVDLSDMP